MAKLVEFIDSASQTPVHINVDNVIAVRPNPDDSKCSHVEMRDGKIIGVKGIHQNVAKQLMA